MRKAMMATGTAATLLLIGAPVAAMQAGAPVSAPMQAGAWGPGGWQAGATAPVATAPAVEPGASMAAPMSAAPAPAAYPQAYPPRRDGAYGHYEPLHPGQKLKGRWSDPALIVQDYPAWGLPRPFPATHWIRYYDDAVLVDGNGRVVDARGAINWDRPRYAAQPPYGYADGGHRAGDVVVTHPAPGTTVTTRYVDPPYATSGYGAPIVAATPGTIVTTETVTTEPVHSSRRGIVRRHRVRRRHH